MHRWWLVHASNDRLEVVDVERPRIEVTIPANDVERMMIENELVEPIVLLHEETEVAHLVVRLELDWPANVALRVRRALLQLTELIAVPLRPPDVSAALHDEELWMIPFHVELVAMQNAAVDDEVVALAERQIAEDRFEGPASLGDVDDLVALRIPVEVRVLLVRLYVEHRDVAVEQQRQAIERWAAAALRLRRAEMPVPERVVLVGLVRELLHPLHGLHRRRRMHVIEQRRRAGEPLVAHQLFRVDPALRPAKRDVPLARNAA